MDTTKQLIALCFCVAINVASLWGIVWAVLPIWPEKEPLQALATISCGAVWGAGLLISTVVLMRWADD